MEANELRIGNYVEVENYKIIQLENIHKKGTTKGDEQYLISMLKPIELSEEWLLKFGFFKEGNNTDVSWFRIGDNENKFGISQNKEYGSNKHLSFMFACGGSYTKSSIDLEIKYVHQLQNIVFNLLGSELELKNE